MADMVDRIKGIFDKSEQEAKEKEFLEKIQKKINAKIVDKKEERKRKEGNCLTGALSVLDSFHSVFDDGSDRKTQFEELEDSDQSAANSLFGGGNVTVSGSMNQPIKVPKVMTGKVMPEIEKKKVEKETAEGRAKRLLDSYKESLTVNEDLDIV
tara:strand:- start:820 stop:1281 length:462 start_codon:yes stop_codon:yes gene_type:complete